MRWWLLSLYSLLQECWIRSQEFACTMSCLGLFQNVHMAHIHGGPQRLLATSCVVIYKYAIRLIYLPLSSLGSNRPLRLSESHLCPKLGKVLLVTWISAQLIAGESRQPWTQRFLKTEIGSQLAPLLHGEMIWSKELIERFGILLPSGISRCTSLTLVPVRTPWFVVRIPVGALRGGLTLTRQWPKSRVLVDVRFVNAIELRRDLFFCFAWLDCQLWLFSS